MSQAHDEALAAAFDVQAPRFERAPVQSDPVALGRLVHIADFPEGARVLDVGCGPGLVSEALLRVGSRVVGVDLSQEMIERARRRCESAGDRAVFYQTSLFDRQVDDLAPFDGVLSRYVLHHVMDATGFIARQVFLLRPGGILVLCDHVTDPLPERARLHHAFECARDSTHTSNLTGGAIVDLLARAGLEDIRYVEEQFTLDFDEWFDRGTPQEPKESVRAGLAKGPEIRGFWPSPQDDGTIRIDCVRCHLRARKPEATASE